MTDQPDPNQLSPEYGVSRDVFKSLQAALVDNDEDLVRYIINPLHPADVADIIEDLSSSERSHFIEIVRGTLDPEVLAQLEDNVREQVLEQFSAEELVAAIADLARPYEGAVAIQPSSFVHAMRLMDASGSQ